MLHCIISPHAYAHGYCVTSRVHCGFASAKCDMRIALMWQITGRVLIIVRGSTSIYKAYHKCTESMCLARWKRSKGVFFSTPYLAIFVHLSVFSRRSSDFQQGEPVHDLCIIFCDVPLSLPYIKSTLRLQVDWSLLLWAVDSCLRLTWQITERKLEPVLL